MKLILLVVCSLIALESTSSARGFCNVDHYGEDENREEARTAAAQFYDGAAKLMWSLAAYERNLPDDVASIGKDAVADLRQSSTTYASAAELYASDSDDGDTEFSRLDPSAIATMALATEESISRLEIGSDSVTPRSLLVRCGEEADKVAAAIEAFLLAVGDEPSSQDFSEPLNVLTEALAAGRVVSAGFAYASGERPQ